MSASVRRIRRVTASIPPRSPRPAVSLTLGAALALLCLGGAPVIAQILADPQAAGRQRPTVLATPSGVPVVQIQTPSAAGVSHNRYRQFDVDAPGAILNNSRTGAPTALGGAVGANPWLARGEARIILNEVRAHAPSRLAGALEVAGTAAQVVIANPAGITCTGCGFINTPRVTLTTGVPLLGAQGSLEAYRVETGTVRVDGAGLDARAAQATEVLARATAFNAALWAQYLSVIHGRNDIAAHTAPGEPPQALFGAHQAVQPMGGATPGTPPPQFALDVAALGGMYAGHIFLVGTEQGLGMRYAGRLAGATGAPAEQLVLHADGRLDVLRGAQLQAHQTAISTTGDIDQSGILIARDRATLRTAGALTNTGTVHASSLQAEAATIVNAGQIRTAGQALLRSTGELTNAATGLLHAGSLDAEAAQLANAGQIRTAEQTTLVASGALTHSGMLHTGHLYAQAGSITHTGRTDTQGHTALASPGAIVQAGQLDTGTLVLQGGTLTQPGTTVVRQAATLDLKGHLDHAGTLAAEQLDLRAGSLAQRGTLGATGHATVRIAGLLRQTSQTDVMDQADPRRASGRSTGEIGRTPAQLRAGSLTLHADQIENTDGAVLFASEALVVRARRVQNTGGAWIASAGTLAIVGPEPVDASTEPNAIPRAALLENHGASIVSGGDMNLHAERIENTNAGFATAHEPVSHEPGKHMVLPFWKPGMPEALKEVQERSAFDWENWERAGRLVHRDTGTRVENWTDYWFARTVSEDRVVASDPGWIHSGGHLQWQSQHFLNDASLVQAQGAFAPSPGSVALTNAGAKGVQRVHDSGTSQYTREEWRGGTKRYHERHRDAIQPYHPADVLSTIDLPVLPRGPHADTRAAPESGLRRIAEQAPRIAAADQPRAPERPAVPDLFGTPGTPHSDHTAQTDLPHDPPRIPTTHLTLGALDAATLAHLRAREQAAQQRAEHDALTDPQAGHAGIRAAQILGQLDGALTGDGGVLLADDTLALRARQVALRHTTVRAGELALHADEDLAQDGGDVHARGHASVTAGQTLTMRATTRATTTRSSQHPADGGEPNTRESIDQYATLTGASVDVRAGTDLRMDAATVRATAGSATVLAGRRLDLGTVQTAETLRSGEPDGDNGMRTRRSLEQGSTIASTGNLTVMAGTALQGRAATLTSERGHAYVHSDGRLALAAGTDSLDHQEAHTHRYSGFLSSGEQADHLTHGRTRAVGSTVSGHTVHLDAGTDQHITGSDIVSTAGTLLTAAGDIDVDAARETRHLHQAHREETHGLLGVGSGGTVGFTVGERRLATAQTDTQTLAAGSRLGSTDGHLVVRAGGAYRQRASDLITPNGTPDVQAAYIDIDGVEQAHTVSTVQQQSQSGLTVAVGHPALAAAQALSTLQRAARQTTDTRSQALAGAAAAMHVASAIKTLHGGQAETGAANGRGNNTNGVGNEGGNGQGPSALPTLTLSLGSASSHSQHTLTEHTPAVSRILSGGQLRLHATGPDRELSGAGAGERAAIYITGAEIRVAGHADIAAKAGQVRFDAATATRTETLAQHASGASVGVTVGLSRTGTLKLGPQLSAQRSRTDGQGQSRTYQPTTLHIGGTLALSSAGDTTLDGAILEAQRFVGDIGGKLLVRSPQDTDHYAEQTRGHGVFLSTDTITLSQQRSDLSVDHRSTSGTYGASGILTGDGGFDIQVGGRTILEGGHIATTQAAVDAGRNRFESRGGLSLQDLSNHSHQTASNESATVGTANAIGAVSENQQRASVTPAGISGIAGHTGVRTGDAPSGALAPSAGERAQLRDSVEAQTQIQQQFVQSAARTVGDLADKLAAQARDKRDTEAAQRWAEGGSHRVAAHAVIGALAGDLSGALGAAAAASAAPILNQLEDAARARLTDAGLPPAMADTLAKTLTQSAMVGLGRSVANTPAAATAAAIAATVDANNRQLHPVEERLIRDNAKRFAQRLYDTAEPTLEQQRAAEALLANTAQNLVDYDPYSTVPRSAQAEAFLQELKLEYAKSFPTLLLPGGGNQRLFYATGDDKAKHWLNESTATYVKNGVIVKTPNFEPEGKGASQIGIARDRLTGLPLDETGRYSQSFVVDGKLYHPKAFPCAVAECLGKNLDPADPQTQAYWNAIDKKSLSDAGKGVSVATIAIPGGSVGNALSWASPVSTLANAVAEGDVEMGIYKITTNFVLNKYLNYTWNIDANNLRRTSAVIDLFDGWGAFLESIKNKNTDN